MESLPNELLIQVASQFDTEAPSVTKFAHEPSSHLTECDFTPLKLLSLVSWRWRKITLPILFRNSRISLDKEPQWVPIDARLVDSMQTQLTKLSNHEFQIYHKMRSKFKSSSTFAYDEAFDDLLINLCRIQDGDDFLKAVPHILWLPHLPKAFDSFARFVAQYDLKHHIKSVVVHTDKEYELRHVSTADAPLARAVADVWTTIFSHLEPVRVVVAAPPSTLAGLLDTQMLSADVWAFDMKMHYIELVQPEPLHLEHMKSKCRAWNSALIHYRPWNHLGYNEGSSIAAYSTYEYHLKQSPKMLYLLLVRLAKEAQSCCNISSFSFAGVFPFVTNVTAIIRALHKIPKLKHISFQLAPGPENNSLDDPKRMGRAQRSDFWLEWNESYKVIAGYLGVIDFEDGAKFKSRDCGNKQLAEDVSGYIELLQQRGAGWRKDGAEDGVWIRDQSLDRVVTPVTELGIV
ncbi:hypothetical protein HBI26_215980 [Parastagonospora nodorum]|nr:hypothetical protein HBH75_202910 [Parastagonospora nodorum]KAH5419632.1 hypothetical protein HBI32_096410 [Parastagonospora nodorum]KAH5557260.1 hypothetical protein HBI26_215980 [Parastagonospora nodorum]KAH5652016.1 hypothetical protein HBI51_081760 [Parastagonospora nodorum]KAH5713308.1 hypothetical protein HBI18_203140 [Parastagonospora nodorum]